MILGVGGQPGIHNWNHTRVCRVCQVLNSKFHFETYLNQLVKNLKTKTSTYCLHARGCSEIYLKCLSYFPHTQ